MAKKYTIQNEQGKRITFEWYEDREPTDSDFAEIESSAMPSTPQPELSVQPPAKEPDIISNIYRPTLQALGAVGGGIVGSGATPIAGTVAGGALGYAFGNKLADVIDEARGVKESPVIGERLKDTASDVMEGAMLEMGGQAAGKAIASGAGALGKGISKVLGSTSGTGSAAVEEAFKNTEGFKRGIAGKVTSDDVLDDALNAVKKLKDIRATDYRTRLAGIQSQSNLVIDKTPVMNKVSTLMDDFNIKTSQQGQAPFPDGPLDFSRSKLDQSTQSKISDVIKDVTTWDDWTPTGADTLRQRIDDAFVETKNSKAFITQLRDTINESIAKEVPEYKVMTREYSRLTNQIRTIEKDLSLGKKSSRDTALRKLNTIFRDVNEYRKGIMDELESASGTPLKGNLAGATMRSITPRGLLSANIPLGGIGLGAFYNPYVLSMLPAYSPYMVGKSAQLAGSATRGLGRVTNPETLSKALWLLSTKDEMQ